MTSTAKSGFYNLNILTVFVTGFMGRFASTNWYVKEQGFSVHSWNIIPTFENYEMDVFNSWTFSLKSHVYYHFL